MNILTPQNQEQPPVRERLTSPASQAFMEKYRPARKLQGKIALVSGGDSGIGRSVCVAFAKEGANVAFIHLEEEEEEAEITAEYVIDEGVECLKIMGDIGNRDLCKEAVDKVLQKFGVIDILVNNAAEQHAQSYLDHITEEQLRRTFDTNFFGLFFLTQATVPHLPQNGVIINSASIVAYQGHPMLIDYSATKGAIVAFTRSLASNLVEKNIRVNAVAPGLIDTPIIPSNYNAIDIVAMEKDAPMGRLGEADEIAPCFVFLACDDSSYMTGQVLHPNGGTIVNG